MDKQTLIDKLNDDLAAELGAVIQYTIYAAQANGPFRPQLAQFFSGEITDELMHAQFLANKIVALGGTPTTLPRSVPGARTNREMVQRIVEAEEQAVRDYTERAQQAVAFGDVGLQVRLEDFVADETTHLEEGKRILEEWHL